MPLSRCIGASFHVPSGLSWKIPLTYRRASLELVKPGFVFVPLACVYLTPEAEMISNGYFLNHGVTGSGRVEIVDCWLTVSGARFSSGSHLIALQGSSPRCFVVTVANSDFFDFIATGVEGWSGAGSVLLGGNMACWSAAINTESVVANNLPPFTPCDGNRDLAVRQIDSEGDLVLHLGMMGESVAVAEEAMWNRRLMLGESALPFADLAEATSKLFYFRDRWVCYGQDYRYA